LTLVLLAAAGCSGEDSGDSNGRAGAPAQATEPVPGPTDGPTNGQTDGQTDEPTAVSPPEAPTAEAPPDPARLRAARSRPVDDPYYPEQGEPYLDALHYGLALDWSAPTRRLTGTTTITFEVTERRSEVQLDLAAELRVTGATLDGAEVSSRAVGDDLVVETGDLTAREPHMLELAYVGTPQPTTFPGTREDIPGLGWTIETDGSVWTMQEPFGAFTWYPVNDHPSDKAFYDATIRTDAGLTSVFNGMLERESTSGDTTIRRWHLPQPAASYLVTIAIGEYAATKANGPAGLPITYWTESRRLPGQLAESPQMLRWLVDLLGPYPFDTVGAVVVPAASAMETQTMVTLGQGVLQNYEYGRTVVLHEYAHQWLGDAVTPDSWPDLWLNEGLTMYVQLLWEDSVGVSDVDATIAEWARRDNADRDTYGPPGAYNEDEWGSINVYFSGAVMLHRIRAHVGNEAFFSALRAWAQGRPGSVNRGDFIGRWSAATEVDLGPFVSRWLSSPTTPRGPVAP
jgi:aminopeptidase N